MKGSGRRQRLWIQIVAGLLALLMLASVLSALALR